MWLHYSVWKFFFPSLSIENMQTKNNILQCWLPPRCHQIISWFNCIFLLLAIQEVSCRGMSFTFNSRHCKVEKNVSTEADCKNCCSCCGTIVLWESRISRVIICLPFSHFLSWESGYFLWAFLQPCFSHSSCLVAVYFQLVFRAKFSPRRLN